MKKFIIRYATTETEVISATSEAQAIKTARSRAKKRKTVYVYVKPYNL